jgi:hypothetical protein
MSHGGTHLGIFGPRRTAAFSSDGQSGLQAPIAASSDAIARTADGLRHANLNAFSFPDSYRGMARC